MAPQVPTTTTTTTCRDRTTALARTLLTDFSNTALDPDAQELALLGLLSSAAADASYPPPRPHSSASGEEEEEQEQEQEEGRPRLTPRQLQERRRRFLLETIDSALDLIREDLEGGPGGLL